MNFWQKQQSPSLSLIKQSHLDILDYLKDPKNPRQIISALKDLVTCLVWSDQNEYSGITEGVTIFEYYER
jgi:hypothetical protein